MIPALATGDLYAAYPKKLSLPGLEAIVRPVAPEDEEAGYVFANSFCEHDLLFLNRDIRRPEVMDAQKREAETGALLGLIALSGAQIIGSAAIVREPFGWSRHVGEIKLMVLPEARRHGLGGALLLDAFGLAVKLGLRKLVARMTPDQTGAITLFMGMGFRGEAMLRNHVMDASGNLHDLTILSQEIGGRPEH